MTRVPVISGRQVVAVLERIGYVVVRRRGSHIRMRNPNEPRRRPVTVPDYSTLKTGTLYAILRDARLTVEELRELL